MMNLTIIVRSIPMDEKLLISDIAALTGLKPGIIRHYEQKGLIKPEYTASGYRVFDQKDVATLLYISLLRRLGLGLDDIAKVLMNNSSSLKQVLQSHKQTLLQERERLDRQIRNIELALQRANEPESIIDLITTGTGELLRPFGRLARPLSPSASQFYRRLFRKGWNMPINAVYTNMMLPNSICEMLEEIAKSNHASEFFSQLRNLARKVVALGNSRSTDDRAIKRLASWWIEKSEKNPLDPQIASALKKCAADRKSYELMHQGFKLWASSISPAASAFIEQVNMQATQKGYQTFIVIPIP